VNRPGIGVTLGAAAAAVPEGALVTLGGFQLNRAPVALLHELIRRRRRVRVVTPPNPIGLDLLVGAGLVEEAESGFLGFQYEDGFVTAPNARRAIERGLLRYRERDVYEIVQALRAAAFGVPFLPAPGGEESDYRRVNGTPVVTDPGSGAGTLVAAAVRPDVLLVHAQEADRDGNLLITDPYAETLQAGAAGRVVATAERLAGRIERPTIPGGVVEALAVVPGGAFPTSCRGFYPYDAAHLRAHVVAASEGAFDAYLERFVTGVADAAAFLAAAGGPGKRGETTGTRAAAGERAAGGPGKWGEAAGERAAAADRLVVALARLLRDGEVVATGVASALPMLAVALALRTHAPRLTYINCVGAVDPALDAALPTSVDARLLDRCRATIGLPELFDLARRGGIDVMFFGAAQVDAAARLNLTCLGEYARPRVKLPGPAGSSSMRPFVRRVVIVVPRHTPRALVERVDFVTAAASPRNRETLVVTDLAGLRLEDGRLRPAFRHAGVGAGAVREATGFALDADPPEAPPPAAEERRALETLDPAGLRRGWV
jgi:acyl CoA:acetate/3-ketoacid CoA transferase alpha subunit/acyl CoA:acetate/3-ketoacid CoA transferase beta subunit